MCTIFDMSPGPSVGIPLSVRAPLELIKGRAHTLERTSALKFHKLTHTRSFLKLYTHKEVDTHAESAVPHQNKQYISRWT
jgi:hypothetical protein